MSGQPLVPVLDVEIGAVVHDSMQIVRVLEERVPWPPLYPPDVVGRAQYLMGDTFRRRDLVMAPAGLRPRAAGSRCADGARASAGVVDA